MSPSPSPETHAAAGPMASPPWPWTRWALYAGAMVCVGLVSVFFAVGVSDAERDVRVFWPERLSASTPGALVMTVTTKDNPPRPSPNAEVTLYQLAPAWGESVAEAVAEGAPRLRQLSTATTDAAGLARLDLPPVAFIPAGPQPPSQGAAPAPNEGHFVVTAPPTPDPLKPDPPSRAPEEIHVLVKVVHDGDVLYAHRSFSIPDRANLALTTDRPLYQPGQRIQARALAADLDTGRPAKGDVRWELRDPRANLIARETTPTSDAGVAAWVVPLAERCVQGNYTLTASFDGRTLNRTLEVRPFRLPRYTVTVTPKALRAEPGKPLTVEVEGRYTYGDPVAGGAVDILVRATRQGAFPSDATYAVKLGDDGKASVVWQAPEDLSPGSAISVEARVTSETGRVERGTATVQASGRALDVDLLSAQGDRWSQGVANTGHLVVRGPDGLPAEGVAITLALPEERAEREVTVTTDAKGHATFTWTPPHSGAFVLDATVTPSGEDGVRPTRHKLRASVDSSAAMIETDSPFAQVGEPYGLTLRNVTTAAALVATHRRYTVAAASAPPSSGPSTASFVFGPEARGLTAIYLYDAYGALLAQTRVWVRQEGTERVTVRADADRYRPGALATVDLDFPPAPPGVEGVTPPAQPVTYGLVGVDEALYALKARTDAPLPVLMRQDPEDVAPLLGALGALDGADSDDPTARKLSAMRFVRALSGTFNTPYLHTDGSTTRAVRRIQRRPWVSGWVTLLGLVLVGITAFAGWATWRGFTRRAWSLKRAAKLVGVGLVAMGAALLLGAIDPPGSVAGGALVWAGVVAAWLIATAVERRDLPLGRWLLATLTLLLICGALAASLAESRPTRWTEAVVAVSFGLPALVWTISIALWALTLHHHALRKPAFGLASWMAIAASMLVFTFALSQGAMEQAMPTSASAPDRFAKFAVKADDAAPMPEEAEDAPADGISTGKPRAGGPRVRSFFPETMVWMPELRSDAQGHAQAKLEVPDSITTWRLNVSASTWDGRFGEAEAQLLVVQPFFVELDLPTHLTVGDAIDTPVTLVNGSDRPLQVTLTALGGDGLASRAAFDAPITVPAKQRVTVSAPVVATAPGEGSLQLTATTDDPALSDAVKRVAAIRPDGRELARSASGIVAEGWRGAVAIPQDALPGTLALDVTVAPGVITDALSGLDSMLRQPDGCFEQTSSANFPNVMILRALRAASPDDFEGGRDAWSAAHTRAQRMVALGYQRMLTFQHGSGGFGLYPDRDPDIMLTAYGLMQLAQMRDVYPVDLNVIRRAAQWLVAQQNEGGSWPVYARRVAGSTGADGPGDAAQLRSTAFVAWALAQSPEPKPWADAVQRALQHAADKLDRADAPDTLALLANAFAAAGRADDAKRALDRLAPQAQRRADHVFWPAQAPTWLWARGAAADIEVTALATHAMLVTETQADLLQPALRYLVASRAPRGGWWSTQATAWTLRTLERLRGLSADKPADLTLTAAAAPLTHAGDPTLPPGKVTVHPNDTQLTAFTATPQAPGDLPVEVATSSKTSAMVQATARFAVPWTSPAATLDDPRLRVDLTLSSRSARRGALVKVVARVRNLTQDRHGATIVELPLPPGAALRRADLEDLETTRRIDRFELLPTHARLYLSGLDPDADLTFVYRFAPMLPGAVSLPPARAYPFYAPDPVAESDGGDISVAP